MRYMVAIVLISLFLFTPPSQAQDANQQRINQAIDAAERICLVGNRYKFSANASGSVTITKFLPGGQGQVVVDNAQGKGSQFFDDETVRRGVDDDIRECMKSQWSAVLLVINAAAPRRIIKVCMGNGGGSSCLNGANASYDCNAYNNMGGGAPRTIEILKQMFCQNGSSTVVNTYNVGGGQCGWTEFTVTCNP